MAAKAELDLREILLTIGLLQPIKVESRGNGVSALCRLVKGQDQAWLRAVEHLLHVGQEHEINFHLGTRFLLKEGVMVKGWFVSIDAKSSLDLKRGLDVFKVAAQQVAEMDPVQEIEVPPTPAAAAPEEDDGEPDPQPTLDPKLLQKRADEYRKHTTATPRALDSAGEPPPPPPGWDPRPRLVMKGTAKDQKNRLVPVLVHEVPLPHVYVDDMNKPNERDRGAKTLG